MIGTRDPATLTRLCRLLTVALLAAALIGCSPARRDLVGRWVVSVPYGWQDQFLRDHRYELQLNEDDTFVLTQRWATGAETCRGTWRVVSRARDQDKLILRPLDPASEQSIEFVIRRGVLGVELQYSASPDHPLRFRRSDNAG